MRGKGVEVEDLERAGIRARGLWRGRGVHGGVHDRGRAESDGGADGVVAGAVAEQEREGARGGASERIPEETPLILDGADKAFGRGDGHRRGQASARLIVRGASALP